MVLKVRVIIMKTMEIITYSNVTQNDNETSNDNQLR